MNTIQTMLAIAAMPGCVFGAKVFSDYFNRASLGANYTTTLTAGDGGAAISGGAFLELTNDASAAANANGRVSVATPFTAFGSPFTGALSANAGLVTWETNLRYNRTSANPSGFNGGLYGVAFVLAGTQADFTGGSGYAVVYGNSSAPDPIRLVRYAGGLSADANLSTIISSGANDLAVFTDYASVRVTYDPAGHLWSLYVRDDGATEWAAPSTLGGGNQIGVATVDSTHTGAPTTHAGFLWNYSTVAAQTAQFDNLSVSVIPEPSAHAGVILTAVATLTVFRRNRRGAFNRPA